MLVQQESQIGCPLMGRSNRHEHLRCVETVAIKYTERSTARGVCLSIPELE